MRYLIVILALCIAYSLQSTVLSFADSLYQNGEYYRAISEYYRSYYDGLERDYCHAQIRNCYLLGEDYEGLIRYLGKSKNSVDNIFSAVAHIRNERADLAAIINDDRSNSINYILYSICKIYTGDFTDAQSRLSDLGDSSYVELRNRLELITSQASDLGYRSPALAGILGIIPGLGYAYSGRWQTAISALVSITMISGISYEMLENKNYLTSGVFSLTGLGFYIGSIYGSVTSAHQYNQTKRKQYLDPYLDGLTQDLIRKEQP